VDVPRADAIAPAGMSSPDRREIACIHTGGVCDPQYTRRRRLALSFALVGEWKLTIRRRFGAAPFQLPALRHLIVSGVPSLRMGRVTAITLVNRRLP
jgi:hypothetical protein